MLGYYLWRNTRSKLIILKIFLRKRHRSGRYHLHGILFLVIIGKYCRMCDAQSSLLIHTIMQTTMQKEYAKFKWHQQFFCIELPIFDSPIFHLYIWYVVIIHLTLHKSVLFQACYLSTVLHTCKGGCLKTSADILSHWSGTSSDNIACHFVSHSICNGLCFFCFFFNLVAMHGNLLL